MAAEEKLHAVGGGCAISEAVSPPTQLETMLHLFGHGTPLSLEMELKKVGQDALRALRTPDVSIRTRDASIHLYLRAANLFSPNHF